jgi:putative iron-dependent peroxidase
MSRAPEQPGITGGLGAAAGRFVVLNVDAGETPVHRVRAALRGVPALQQTLAALPGGAGLCLTVGIGAEMWTRLSPAEQPAQLAELGPLVAGKRRMPATGGDLLLHVSGAQPDLCYEAADRLLGKLGNVVEVLDDVAGFRYLDGRDLIGFVDGTENPLGEERAEAALIGDEDPRFAGGSYVLAQRWVHELRRWRILPDAEQERIVGRSKPDSVELEDKPATSHVARVVIEEDGAELQIVRHSMPYGGLRERGLYFMAYARRRDIFDQMLARMVGLGADGLSDGLLQFSTPVTGAYFFAPSLSTLAEL